MDQQCSQKRLKKCATTQKNQDGFVTLAMNNLQIRKITATNAGNKLRNQNASYKSLIGNGIFNFLGCAWRAPGIYRDQITPVLRSIRGCRHNAVTKTP